jgi:hypothetical protein
LLHCYNKNYDSSEFYYEKLAEGGMGTIYKARDERLDRFVALKFLPPYFSARPEPKSRFIQEAKAAAALDHARDHVRVNAVCPGTMETPMNQALPPDRRAFLIDQVPMRRIGEPSEIAAVALFLARTRLGKAMRAVADNRDLAAISGIDVDRIGAYVWLLAGALAGLGGVMFGVVQGTFEPNLGSQVLFLIFTTVVLGGIGSAYGALVAGLVLGLVMDLSTWSGFFGGLDARFKPVLAFAALILLLLYRPQGLFGKARVL